MAGQNPMDGRAPLRREDGDGIATLLLDRPEAYNALSVGLMEAMLAELDRIAVDGSTRVVVIAGAGRGFCAGHDLRELRANPDLDFYKHVFGLCSRLMQRIVSLPKPVIARVHGVATAAGCQLVASCDLAVAAEGARFAVPGVNIGLFCSTPMVALTGDMVEAPRARELGLVNRVVPEAELERQVRALAAQVASKSPLVLAIGKEAFYRQAEMDLASAYGYASDVMARNMMARDAGIGIDALLSRTRPEWCGR